MSTFHEILANLDDHLPFDAVIIRKRVRIGRKVVTQGRIDPCGCPEDAASAREAMRAAGLKRLPIVAVTLDTPHEGCCDQKPTGRYLHVDGA
jgi:hypothetical protein